MTTILLIAVALLSVLEILFILMLDHEQRGATGILGAAFEESFDSSSSATGALVQSIVISAFAINTIALLGLSLAMYIF